MPAFVLITYGDGYSEHVEFIIGPEEARLYLVKLLQLPPIPKKLYSLNVLFKYFFW